MIAATHAPRPAAPAVRATSPVVVARHHRRQGIFGLLDEDELTPRQLRAAYRSLSAMLVNYRAKFFAPLMHGSVVERRLGGEQDLWEEVEPEHPWVRLLVRPAGTGRTRRERMKVRQAAISWHKFLFMGLDALGHADFLVGHGRPLAGGPRMPTRLLPLYAEEGRLEPHYDSEGAVEAWQLQYTDGRAKTLPPEDALRIQYEHPTARYRTAGLFERAAYEIDQMIAGNVFARDRMEERGLPEVMLEAKEEMNPGKLQALSNDFAQSYRAGAGRGVPVSHGGLAIKPLSLSQSEMQFQEQRAFVVDLMFMLYEVHKGLFAETATEANAKVARISFFENTAQPAVDEAAAKIAHEFERLFEAEPGVLRITPPSAVPVDEQLREEINQLRLARGVPPNRIMQEMGEDPVEGGDEPLVQGTLVPLSGLGVF